MLVIHAMLSPDRGGIEAAFVAWTEALRILGHDVICLVAPGAKVIPDLPHQVGVTPLPEWLEGDPVAIWRARRMMARTRPALIVTHGNRAGRLLRAAHRGTVRHVSVLHRPRFKGLDAFDAVACVSRGLMAEAARAGVPAHRLRYVPNFLPSPIGAARPLPRRDGPPIVGVLARLVPEKGLDLFLEAIAGLPEVRAIIAGEGPERPALETAIRRLGLDGRVTLAGWVTDKAAFFRGLDVLCLPSRRESFGIVVLEGWAHGVPVVATRTSGPSEVIETGRSGLLCDVSADALRASLREVLDNPALAARLAAGGMEAAQGYRLQAQLPQLRQVLDGPLAPVGVDEPVQRSWVGRFREALLPGHSAGG